MRVRAEFTGALIVLLQVACGEALPPVTGAVRIVVATAGTDVDPDGYRIYLGPGAGESLGTIASVGSLVVDGLRPGAHRITLNGIAANCAGPSLATTRSLNVTVIASDTIDASFDVSCAANVGRIAVQVLSAGADPDPDGYLVSLDAAEPVAISSPGMAYENVPVGAHTLSFSGAASNCSLLPATLPTDVRFGSTSNVQHTAFCVARLGHLRVHATTTGVDLDTDGYLVEVEGRSVDVPSNGVGNVADVREGTRAVRLNAINPNCTVVGDNPRSVSVGFQLTQDVTFDVTCVAGARVRVSTVATGVDVDPSYRVRVEGPGVDRSEMAPLSTQVTFVALASGTHTVTLDDVRVNCVVDAATPNPRTIALTMGQTIDVVFNVACSSAPTIAFIGTGSTGFGVYSAKANGTNPTPLTSNGSDDHDPTYSPDGSRIAFRSGRDGNLEVYVMNADGSAQTRLTNDAGADVNPEWSPDGSKLAFRSTRDGNDEIYVMNADGSNVTRLTNHPGADQKPTWSPDGSKIAFMSSRSGQMQIWVMNADGSQPKRLTTTTDGAELPSWSPDGSKIAFVRWVPCDDYYYACHNIHVMNTDGTGEVRLETRSHDTEPVWSPDGQWLAFETIHCNYYSCSAAGVAAVKPNGTGRTMLVSGQAYNPTWKP